MKRGGIREGNIMRKTGSVVVLILVAMLLPPFLFTLTTHASLNSASDSNDNHAPALNFTKSATLEIANLSYDEISALGTAIDKVLSEEWKSGSIRKPVLVRAKMLAGEAKSVGGMFSGLTGFFRKLLAPYPPFSYWIEVKPPEKMVTLTEETELAVQFIEGVGTQCLPTLGPEGALGAFIVKVLSPVAQWGAKEWAEWRSLDASLLRVTKPGVGTMDVIYSKESEEANVIIVLEDFEGEMKARYGWGNERLYLFIPFDTKPPNLRRTAEGFDYKIVLRSEEVRYATTPSEPPQATSPAPVPTPPEPASVIGTEKEDEALSVLRTRILDKGDEWIHGFTYYNGAIWASTRTSPGRILKIDPDTLEYDRIICEHGLNDGEDLIATNGYIWTILYTSPSKLVRIDPNTLRCEVVISFTSNEIRYGGSLEHASGYLWAGGQGKIARIDLNNMNYEIYDYSSVIGSAQFHALASGGGYIWGSCPVAKTILRINPTDPTDFGSLRLDAPTSDDIAYANNHLYVGSEATPSYIYRIADDLSYSREEITNTVNYSVVYHGDRIWVAHVGTPGKLFELDLGLNSKTLYTLPAGFNNANEIAFDESGNMFVTCWESPAKIVKFSSNIPKQPTPQDITHALTDELRLMIATIYGEAASESEASWEAIANVIMNRVGKREWGNKGWNTVTDIIKYSGFDAYTKKNDPYRTAVDYLDNRDGSNKKIERLITITTAVYNRETKDITGGAVLYYSPGLLPKGPKDWNFNLLEEVKVPGTENDDFKFYKYK